jgi:hypothetical protein
MRRKRPCPGWHYAEHLDFRGMPSLRAKTKLPSIGDIQGLAVTEPWTQAGTVGELKRSVFITWKLFQWRPSLTIFAVENLDGLRQHGAQKFCCVERTPPVTECDDEQTALSFDVGDGWFRSHPYTVPIRGALCSPIRYRFREIGCDCSQPAHRPASGHYYPESGFSLVIIFLLFCIEEIRGCHACQETDVVLP